MGSGAESGVLFAKETQNVSSDGAKEERQLGPSKMDFHFIVVRVSMIFLFSLHCSAIIAHPRNRVNWAC